MDKVLIVDDEQPVVDGLSYLIAKHFEDITCSIARTGREAIEMVRLHHPDIVLMDVRMPGISGIDAIRELKQVSPQTVYIVVTAYERFEIAKEAVGLGVFDYLLKPLAREALVDVLNRARHLVSERRHQQFREISTKDWKDEAEVFLEQTLLFHLAARPENLEIDHLLKLLNLEADKGCVVWYEWQKASLSGKTEFEQWRSLVKFKLRCAVGPWKDGRFAVFLPVVADSNPWEKLPLPPEKVLWRAFVGTVEPLERFSYSYGEALWALGTAEWGCLNLKAKEAAGPPSYPYELEQELLKSISRGEVEQTAPLATAYVQALAGQTRSESEVTTALVDFLAVLAYTRAQEGVEIPREELKHLRDALPTEPSATEAFTQFILRWTYRARKGGDGSPLVEKTMEFLRENFQKPISLDDAARYVGVHPQYLSRTFSQERGQNFVDVLTRLRMAKAREMLREGRSVKETSAQLGYSDPGYFSRLFKKWEGLSPGDFAQGKREKL